MAESYRGKRQHAQSGQAVAPLIHRMNITLLLRRQLDRQRTEAPGGCFGTGMRGALRDDDQVSCPDLMLLIAKPEGAAAA